MLSTKNIVVLALVIGNCAIVDAFPYNIYGVVHKNGKRAGGAGFVPVSSANSSEAIEATHFKSIYQQQEGPIGSTDLQSNIKETLQEFDDVANRPTDYSTCKENKDFHFVKPYFYCPSRVAPHQPWSCIRQEDLCNNHADCPNGEDENAELCMFVLLERSRIRQVERMVTINFQMVENIRRDMDDLLKIVSKSEQGNSIISRRNTMVQNAKFVQRIA